MRDLKVWLINSWIGFLSQPLLLHIVHNTDDGEPISRFGLIFHGNAPPKRITARPQGLRHGLAYNHNPRRSCVVAFVKFSPPQQSDSHGSEISWAHTRLVHDVAGGPLLTTFHLKIAHGQLTAE